MAMPATAPIELKGLTLEELETFAREVGEPPYRGRQLARWIYRGGAGAFAEMTDLPAALRTALAARARLTALAPVAAVRAAACAPTVGCRPSSTILDALKSFSAAG